MIVFAYDAAKAVYTKQGMTTSDKESQLSEDINKCSNKFAQTKINTCYNSIFHS